MTSSDRPGWRQYIGTGAYSGHVHLKRLLPSRDSLAFERMLAVLRRREQRRSDGLQ